MSILAQTVETVKRMRKLFVMMALIYIGSYLSGWYLVSINSPVATEGAQLVSGAVSTQAPFTTILESLRGGELVRAILITFFVNLSTGAFLSTTLPGIVPLLGAVATVAITVFRGFTIGLIYPEILASSPAGFVLGFGTMILELGAYVFSGGAGINIALAPILPKRYGVQSRWAAFKMAWKDAARVYVIVIILLALGAIWEMTGIFLVLNAP
jgi:hypothetical protein